MSSQDSFVIKRMVLLEQHHSFDHEYIGRPRRGSGGGWPRRGGHRVLGASCLLPAGSPPDGLDRLACAVAWAGPRAGRPWARAAGAQGVLVEV